MINFFETDLSTIPTQHSNKKSRLAKYISAGVGLLASVGIGIKTGSTLAKYKETVELMERYSENIWNNIFYRMSAFNINKAQGKFIDDYLKQNGFTNVRSMPIEKFVDMHDKMSPISTKGKELNARYADIVIEEFRLTYSSDPVKAVNIISKEYGTVQQPQSYFNKPPTEHISAFERKFSSMDEFFASFGITLTKIPLIGRMTKALTQRFGDTKGYAISMGIIGVLVIILIIGMYYLIRFLYRRYKQRKLRQKANLSN